MAGPSPSYTADTRWAVLGGVRFVLAAVVVCGHLTWFTLDGHPVGLTALDGTAAVIGFLVISGYSIGHSLERRPVGFYRRRVARIYPLYAASVLFALVPYAFAGNIAMTGAVPDCLFGRPHVATVLGNLLLLQNVACLPIDPNPALWTLGIEVGLYAAAPMLRAWPSWAVCALGAASAGFFAIYPHLGLRHYATLRWGLPHALFAWAWLGGFVLQRAGTTAWLGLALAVGTGLMLLVNPTFTHPAAGLTAAAVVVAVTVARRVPIGPSIGRVLNYVGELSYPLYLFHFPALLLGYDLLGIRGVGGLAAWATAVSMAALFVERTVKPLYAWVSPRRVIPTRPA